MFGRAVVSFIALIAVLAGAAYFFHVRIGPRDVASFRKLCNEKKTQHSRQAYERQPTVQFRENVQKDIWFSDGGERLHFFLKSSQSELILTQRKDKVEAIEKLKQVDSWIQEEIDKEASVQQVRRISADTGVYSLPDYRFEAQSVKIAFYRLPGTDLPTHTDLPPFFFGTADGASFAANEKLPTFKAYHLKARLVAKPPQRSVP